MAKRTTRDDGTPTVDVRGDRRRALRGTRHPFCAGLNRFLLEAVEGRVGDPSSEERGAGRKPRARDGQWAGYWRCPDPPRPRSSTPGRATDGGLPGHGADRLECRPVLPRPGRGEALNLVNARYGTEPGAKAYSPISDRFFPSATQTIPPPFTKLPTSSTVC